MNNVAHLPTAYLDEAVDSNAVGLHCWLLHHLAGRAQVAGKLVLCRYGEDPHSGRELYKDVRHFRIGDIVGMMNCIFSWRSQPHSNIYIPLTVLRSDLDLGKRGTDADIVAVLGCAVDGDADKGPEAPRPPLPATYV